MRISLLGIALCLIAATKHEPHIFKTRQTLPTNKPQVVLILTNLNQCTGWVAGKNIIVTAAHCFKPETTQTVAVFTDGHFVKLKILRIGERDKGPMQDIAVLSGDTGEVEPLQIADPSTLPQYCYSIGYGGNEQYQKAITCFGGASDITEDGMIIFHGDLDLGDSGGPTLNLAGQVIGMQIQINSEVPPRALFFDVPTNIIREYLK